MAKPSKWETVNEVELQTSKGTTIQVKLIRVKEKPDIKMIAFNKLAQNIAIEAELKDELINAIKEVCEENKKKK